MTGRSLAVTVGAGAGAGVWRTAGCLMATIMRTARVAWMARPTNMIRTWRDNMTLGRNA